MFGLGSSRCSLAKITVARARRSDHDTMGLVPAAVGRPRRRTERIRRCLDTPTRRRGDRAGELLHVIVAAAAYRQRQGRRQWIEKTCCTLFLDPPVGFAAILTAVGVRAVFAFTFVREEDDWLAYAPR